MNRLVMGLSGGCAATVPMSAVMMATRRYFPAHAVRAVPPQQIVDRLAMLLGLSRRRFRHRAAASLAHFGFGAAAGALYAPLARRLPGPAAVRGAAYGALVWGINYAGVLPAVGLQPPASRQPPGRNVTMIAAHLVWGASLGIFVEALERRRAAAQAAAADVNPPYAAPERPEELYPRSAFDVASLENLIQGG
jgi:uncharacterized membrane protein YagU involved in acid resistance